MESTRSLQGKRIWGTCGLLRSTAIISAGIIGTPDNDFGVWCVDVMEYPERYEGKAVPSGAAF